MKTRPFLKEMLETLKPHFELILFTSSSKHYCEGLVTKIIEKEGEIFDFKLYGKHCQTTMKPGSSISRIKIKNLEILTKGRDLRDIVLVDNRSENYCFQPQNGIPIRDFNGEENDRALPQLTDFLLTKILPADDVREVI